MGLLDTLSKFGFAVEEAFTPQTERLQNQALRDRILQEKRLRELEARRQELISGLFQGNTPPQGPVSLDRGAPPPTINRGQGGLAGMFPGLTPEIAAAFPERTADAFFSRFAPQGENLTTSARDFLFLRKQFPDMTDDEIIDRVYDTGRANDLTQQQINLLTLDINRFKLQAGERDEGK